MEAGTSKDIDEDEDEEVDAAAALAMAVLALALAKKLGVEDDVGTAAVCSVGAALCGSLGALDED